MNNDNIYIIKSLELNMFFLRIMKEHALFMSFGFIEKNRNYIDRALNFNKEFNALLNKTTDLSRDVILIDDSMVTDYTLKSENIIMHQTGIAIDTRLTQKQVDLKNQGLTRLNNFDLLSEVRTINNQSIDVTTRLINFKDEILNDQLMCEILYNVYPLLIDHIRREAMLYVDLLNRFENNEFTKVYTDSSYNEIFWNHIMEEHSEFIRGLLDPTEIDLIEIANSFALQYETLNRKTYNEYSSDKIISTELINEALSLTQELRTFNTEAVQGLISCEIKSILNPLIADHILRESNHYLKLLKNNN